MQTKEKFVHRDISWLEFNGRVLQEAMDERNPLLERLKFMAIFSTNLDEFFMVRYSGAQKLVDSGYNRKDQFGLYPHELLQSLDELIEKYVYKYY